MSPPMRRTRGLLATWRAEIDRLETLSQQAYQQQEQDAQRANLAVLHAGTGGLSSAAISTQLAATTNGCDKRV